MADTLHRDLSQGELPPTGEGSLQTRRIPWVFILPLLGPAEPDVACLGLTFKARFSAALPGSWGRAGSPSQQTLRGAPTVVRGCRVTPTGLPVFGRTRLSRLPCEMGTLVTPIFIASGGQSDAQKWP